MALFVYVFTSLYTTRAKTKEGPLYHENINDDNPLVVPNQR